MGEPVEVSDAYRADTRGLASRIVESVKADERMSTTLAVILAGAAPPALKVYEATDVRDLLFRLAQEVLLLRAEADAKALAAAHRKIGEARKVVEEFWSLKIAADPYVRATAWAMHVALVQLASIFSRRPAREDSTP